MKFSIELEIEVTKNDQNNWTVLWLDSLGQTSSSLEIALAACAQYIQRNITSEWLSIKLIEGFRAADKVNQ